MAKIEMTHHVAKSRNFPCKSKRSNAMPTLKEDKAEMIS
jgi:hypothetical protein